MAEFWGLEVVERGGFVAVKSRVFTKKKGVIDFDL